MRIACRLLTVGFFASLSAAPAAANLLDAVFPRSKQVCYSATARPGTTRAIKMLRLTRPIRLHAQDNKTSRVVRAVINFTGEGNPRTEDAVTCRSDGSRIACLSTTCDGTGFTLEVMKGGDLRIDQEQMSPNVIWACDKDEIREIALTDDELSLILRKGSGSCLD